MGNDLGVHRTTVNKTIWIVCSRILARAGNWIKFPQTQLDFVNAQELWASKYTFPSAIGAIDCSLFEITKPKEYGDEYICRKGIFLFLIRSVRSFFRVISVYQIFLAGYAAINMQATVDASEKFTSIDCQWAGSVHDARIWRNSGVKAQLENNNCGALLLADEGYPLSQWMMKIYPNPHEEYQKAFNRLLKKERVIVERVFGQLKKRFPALGNRIRVATANVPKMITACCVLHNVAKYLNEPDVEGPCVEEEEEVQINNEEQPEMPMANERRDLIARQINQMQ